MNALLHSHLAGRKIRTRHIRDGKELPVLFEDNHYDFDYQLYRNPLPGTDLKIMPGDEIFTECDFETSDRNVPTFGGDNNRLIRYFLSLLKVSFRFLNTRGDVHDICEVLSQDRTARVCLLPNLGDLVCCSRN